MNYFVSCIDSQYHHWQIELLIESFKKNQCEKDLILCISESPMPYQRNENFLKNISQHKKSHFIRNLGKERDCAALNKLYSLITILLNSKMDEQFWVIDPDVVLSRRIDPRIFKADYPQFIFSIDPSFTLEMVESSVGPFYNWVGLNRDLIENNWLPIGEVYMFDKFPISFFYRVLEDAENLVVRQMLAKKDVWEKTLEVSLICNIIKNISNVYCRGEYNISSPMDSPIGAHFISYKNGCLPSFHKSMFSFKPPMCVSFGDPIKTLSTLRFSPSSNYISDLARSCLEKR